jgi:hypothetical protein
MLAEIREHDHCYDNSSTQVMDDMDLCYGHII